VHFNKQHNLLQYALQGVDSQVTIALTHPKLCQAIRQGCELVALHTHFIQVLQLLPTMLWQLLQLVAMQL
jgi:hypothetical protein